MGNVKNSSKARSWALEAFVFRSLPGPNDPMTVDQVPELISAASSKYPINALEEARKNIVGMNAFADTEVMPVTAWVSYEVSFQLKSK